MSGNTEELVARRVNWYSPIDEVTRNPARFIAQIMARGNPTDISFMRDRFPLDQQQEAYINAPPGLFDRRTWAYWGLVLFDCPTAHPFPERLAESANLDWRG